MWIRRSLVLYVEVCTVHTSRIRRPFVESYVLITTGYVVELQSLLALSERARSEHGLRAQLSLRSESACT